MAGEQRRYGFHDVGGRCRYRVTWGGETEMEDELPKERGEEGEGDGGWGRGRDADLEAQRKEEVEDMGPCLLNK